MLELEALKGVKMAILGAFLARIAYLTPVLASRANLWPIFMDYVILIVPLGMLEAFLSSESWIIEVSKANSMSKKQIFGD